MIADIAFHKLDSDNPHFHVMLTTRKLSPDGKSFGQKERSWNSKEKLQEWRKGWADTANEHMQRAGIDARIDHRSLAEQKAELDALPSPSVEQQAQAISLDRPATIHRGHSGNQERLERFDALQEVKVSQEAKAQSHIEKHSSKPSPAAPASSPSASSNDAIQGGDKNPLDKFGKVGEYIQSKIDKDDVSSKQEKQTSNKDSKSSNINNSKAVIGSTSDVKLTDETKDKNLHLTEAQKEELEELEEDEKKVRKAILSDGGGKLDQVEDYKPQSKTDFLSKFKKAKSFTEQRFNEEKEAYENSRKKNKYTPR